MFCGEKWGFHDEEMNRTTCWRDLSNDPIETNYIQQVWSRALKTGSFRALSRSIYCTWRFPKWGTRISSILRHFKSQDFPWNKPCFSWGYLYEAPLIYINQSLHRLRIKLCMTPPRRSWGSSMGPAWKWTVSNGQIYVKSQSKIDDLGAHPHFFWETNRSSGCFLF